MPFTQAELDNLGALSLETFLDRGKVHWQDMQAKPMLQAFERAATTFHSGNQKVSLAVSSSKNGPGLTGYTHDDVVSYQNITGAKRVEYYWREHHQGFSITDTELKIAGITVVESGPGQSTSKKSDREKALLAEIYDEKVKQLKEGLDLSLDSLIHGDGTSDPKAIAGVRAFILDNPAAGSTGGLSRVDNVWWRNRAATAAANTAGSGFAPIVSNPANGGALMQFLQEESRQLLRYGPNRKSMKFAGTDFISALERELRANGQLAQFGWSGSGQNGTTDGYIPTLRFKGGEIKYDPTLDDLGLSKRMYDIDMNSIQLKYMNGERRKQHNPRRPHNQYVMYKAVTSTGVMVANKLNSSAVYDIA